MSPELEVPGIGRLAYEVEHLDDPEDDCERHAFLDRMVSHAICGPHRLRDCATCRDAEAEAQAHDFVVARRRARYRSAHPEKVDGR